MRGRSCSTLRDTNARLTSARSRVWVGGSNVSSEYFSVWSKAAVCALGGAMPSCHPFLVHAAQPHHGTEPRFMAQPPLMQPGHPMPSPVVDAKGKPLILDFC